MTRHVPRVQELLEQHRPKPGETDLRGFEWHYLNRLCHADLLTLKRQAGVVGIVGSAAYSPDGKRLLTFTGASDLHRAKWYVLLARRKHWRHGSQN